MLYVFYIYVLKLFTSAYKLLFEKLLRSPYALIISAARSVPFQPTLTEAYSSKTIGFISISLIMAVGSVFLVSDVPLIIAQLKGLRRVVRPGDVYSGRF